MATTDDHSHTLIHVCMRVYCTYKVNESCMSYVRVRVHLCVCMHLFVRVLKPDLDDKLHSAVGVSLDVALYPDERLDLGREAI